MKILSLLLLTLFFGCAVPSKEMTLSVPVPLYKQMTKQEIVPEDYGQESIVFNYKTKWYEMSINFSKLADGSITFTSSSDTDNAANVNMYQQQQAQQSFSQLLQLALELGKGNPSGAVSEITSGQ